jgi:hypothetical protein
LRAAQDVVAKTVTNSGLAVTIDVGDTMDVHPKDKREVGERLALVALARHYGKKVPYCGPRFASAEKLPGALRLSFTHTDGGLVVKGDKLEEFSLAKRNGIGPTRRLKPMRGGFDIRSAQPSRRALRLASQSQSDSLQRRWFARHPIPDR